MVAWMDKIIVRAQRFVERVDSFHRRVVPVGTIQLSGRRTEANTPSVRGSSMSRDERKKRDVHALDGNGMVLCNPRDKEAAHRAEMEEIVTGERGAVTCV